MSTSNGSLSQWTSCFPSSSSSSSDRTLSKSLKLSERFLGERDAWEREIKLCSNMLKQHLKLVVKRYFKDTFSLLTSMHITSRFIFMPILHDYI